jgi:hypothetical protein
METFVSTSVSDLDPDTHGSAKTWLICILHSTLILIVHFSNVLVSLERKCTHLDKKTIFVKCEKGNGTILLPKWRRLDPDPHGSKWLDPDSVTY